MRYEQDSFPQDLRFQVTPNSEHFQARYVITHPAKGDLTCAPGQDYIRKLESRRDLEVKELTALAGWTNPNYVDYITEYSRKAKPDKYAPQRNSFLPTSILPIESSKKDSFGKWILLLGVLVGIVYLKPRNARKNG